MKTNQHYDRACELLREAELSMHTQPSEIVERQLLAAQVHATLALRTDKP